jgi:hypothetical protein
MAAFFLPSGEVVLDQFGNKNPQTRAQIEQQLRRTYLLETSALALHFLPPSVTGIVERVRKE